MHSGLRKYLETWTTLENENGIVLNKNIWNKVSFTLKKDHFSSNNSSQKEISWYFNRKKILKIEITDFIYSLKTPKIMFSLQIFFGATIISISNLFNSLWVKFNSIWVELTLPSLLWSNLGQQHPYSLCVTLRYREGQWWHSFLSTLLLMLRVSNLNKLITLSVKLHCTTHRHERFLIRCVWSLFIATTQSTLSTTMLQNTLNTLANHIAVAFLSRSCLVQFNFVFTVTICLSSRLFIISCRGFQLVLTGSLCVR